MGVASRPGICAFFLPLRASAPPLQGLHGLGSQCLQGRCPTIFSAPPTLGASFNSSLMAAVGVAIGDEVRAMNNANGTRQWSDRPVDLNLWLPSINMDINVQWGRNIEVYGEWWPYLMPVLQHDCVRLVWRLRRCAPIGDCCARALVAWWRGIAAWCLQARTRCLPAAWQQRW